MTQIIDIERSIIPACDVDLKKFEEIVSETHDITYIGGYKISATLALSVGLPAVVETAKRYTKKPLIYDHQKAGTDIPDTGKAFMKLLKECGIDAVIICPLTGPATRQLDSVRSRCGFTRYSGRLYDARKIPSKRRRIY